MYQWWVSVSIIRMSICSSLLAVPNVTAKINRGRHTDHPAGRHSIRSNQAWVCGSRVGWTLPEGYIHTYIHTSRVGVLSPVRMEWCPAGWSVCLPLLISTCTIKSRSSLLAPAHLPSLTITEQNLTTDQSAALLKPPRCTKCDSAPIQGQWTNHHVDI